MDFSRLHTYTPPHCLPENTGYTYALSSSYSSSALDFETENKIDPVFDSPRMSRRSLRLSAAALKKSSDAPKDTHPDSSYAGNLSFREQSSKVLKHRPSVNKKSGSARHTPRKNLSRSSIVCQSSFNSHASDASIVSSALGESRIREQREVNNFWGLDDEGDPKGSDTTLMQGNGDTETAENSTVVNGYTCRDYRMLSKRKEVLTAYSPSHVPSSRIYSRDRSQKHASSYFMLDVLQTVGATGWLVSQKVVSLLWLAVLSPGRAASGMYRLLRTGWYQLATLMSLLKVFLLKRCLPKTYKLFLFLLPLLFLLGIWFWGFDGFFSLLPSLNWIKIDRIQRTEDSLRVREPQADSLHSVQPPEGTINIFASGRESESELEKQMAFLSERYHHLDEKYSKVMLLLQNLQDQVAQKSDKSKTLTLIRNMMGQHPQDVRLEQKQAQTIVNNALKLFSQDKTGMVDFALESAGGSILSTRCSETYDSKTTVISLFGIPLWYVSQPPSAVIQPDMYPGNCWAFKGSQGYLVVRLSRKIYPTAFTLEHIPKALSATGEISSALRSFAVYGLDNEYQEGGKLLGQYVYDQDGEPLQTFPVMEKSENAFQIVELRVFSNWGHPEYTCLYRFRVHGKLAE